MAKAHRRPDRSSQQGGRWSPRAIGIAALVVVAVALVAVLGVQALTGDDNGPGSADGSANPTGSATGSPSAAQSSPSTTAPETVVPTGPQPKARTYTGRGDKVVKIKKPGNATGAVLVFANHPGGGSFNVLALDSSDFESDILVNVAGRYKGTNLLDVHGTETQRLKVLADGAWTIKVRPLASAEPFARKAKGTGDAVLLYTGVAGTASITHDGKSNFVVTAHSGTTDIPLADEVGPFHGEVKVKKGPLLVDVTADGHWTIKVLP